MKKLTNEQLELLKAPIPAEAITQHPSKKYLSTIKAIYVIERLNQVFGPGQWRTESKIVNLSGDCPYLTEITKTGKTFYTILMDTFFEVPEYGIGYRVSASSTNDDIGDAAKGATTSGISKIASYLGIGIDVYKGRGSKPQAQAHRPENNLPWLNEKDKAFVTEAAAIILGGRTVEQIRKRYKISKPVAEKLAKVSQVDISSYRAEIARAKTPEQFQTLADTFASLKSAVIKYALNNLLSAKMKAEGIGYKKTEGFYVKEKAAA